MFRRIHSQVARKIVAEIFCALLEGQSDTFWWLGRILFLMTIVSKYKQNCTDTDNKSLDTQQVIILDLWELPSQKYLVYT